MFKDCIYFNVATLDRMITKIWQDEFIKFALSPSHGYLLFVLMEKPMLTQKELSEIMELKASTITRFVDDLVKKGLIDKIGKGKVSTIKISDAGKKMCKQINRSTQLLLQQMQEKIGKETFEEFVSLATSIKNTLQEK